MDPRHANRHRLSERPGSRQIPKTPAVPTDPSVATPGRPVRAPGEPDPWDGLENTQNLEDPERLDPVVKNSTEFMGILNIFGEYVLRALLSQKSWKLRHAALRKMRRDVSQMPAEGEFSGAVVESVAKVLEVCSLQAVIVLHTEAFALFNDTIEAGKQAIEGAARRQAGDGGSGGVVVVAAVEATAAETRERAREKKTRKAVVRGGASDFRTISPVSK